MKIEFYKKDVYGNTMLYIKDDEIATHVHRLTSKKTIDENDMKHLEFFGCQFVQVLN